MTRPSYWPHSGPALNQALSRGGAFRYAFCMSEDNIYKSFKSARIKVILRLSYDVTNAYVITEVVSIVCPPATKQTFWVSMVALISNIGWHPISWYPTGDTLTSSFTSKATRTFSISLYQSSRHRLVPFCLSNWMAWFASIWNVDTVLVCRFPISRLDFGYHIDALPKSIGNTPNKFLQPQYTVCLGVLSDLDDIRLFYILKIYPWLWPSIFRPLY